MLLAKKLNNRGKLTHFFSNENGYWVIHTETEKKQIDSLEYCHNLNLKAYENKYVCFNAS